MIEATKRAPWLRVLLEGAVIVSSILLAFGIEVWWGGRAETDRARTLLEGLASDFATAEVELDRVFASHGEQFFAAGRLLQLADSPTSVELAPVVDSLIYRLIDTITLDPPMGTLRALIAGGRRHSGHD